jgi:hypothetical protein
MRPGEIMAFLISPRLLFTFQACITEIDNFFDYTGNTKLQNALQNQSKAYNVQQNKFSC